MPFHGGLSLDGACLLTWLLLGGCPPAARTHELDSQALAQQANAVLRLPLRTSGRYIVDAGGLRVRLACVNWYGAHLPQMAMNGLNHQRADNIAKTIVGYGFNCVRLPFSMDMVFRNLTHVPHPNKSLRANPELMGKSPIEVFDAALQALTDRGLMVILNNHVSSSKWCCTPFDGEGLWYTAKYSVERWLDGLAWVARRYKSNPLVVGFDLRNEVRTSRLGSPTWGGGPPDNDWARGAVEGATRVLGENGDMLIIISGLEFSILLCDVPRAPVHQTVPSLRNRTVYTVHEYHWFNIHVSVGSVAKALSIGGLVVLAAALCGACAHQRVRRWRAQQRRAADAGAPAVRPARPARCSRCRCALPRWLGPAAGVALALLSVLCRCTSRAWLRTCNFWKLIAGEILGVCCLLLASAGAVVWLWLALACWRRSTERRIGAQVEAAEGAVPTCRGLPPGAAAGAAAAAARAPRIPSDSAAPGQSQGLQLPAVPAGAAPPCAEGRLPGDGPSRPGGSPSGSSSANSSIHWQEGGPEPPLQDGGRGGVPSGLERLHRQKRRLDHALSTRCFLVSMYVALLSALVFAWFDLEPYEAFEAELDKRWGFLLEGPDAVPVWLGEFGSNQHSDLEWAHIQRYILAKELDWAYWSINGEKFNGVDESFGILGKDSATVRDAWRLRDLRALIRAAGLGPPARRPASERPAPGPPVAALAPLPAAAVAV